MQHVLQLGEMLHFFVSIKVYYYMASSMSGQDESNPAL